MALTRSYFELTITLADRGNKRTTRRYRMAINPAQTDMTAVYNGVTTHMGQLALLTACKIVRVTVALVMLETAYTTPTAAQAENETEALITAQIKNKPNKKGTLTIPGPLDAVFKATSGVLADEVDITFAALQNWLSYFDNAIVGYYFVSDGEPIDRSTAKGVRRHRHSEEG